MNLDLKPSFRLELSSSELVLILKALKKRDDSESSILLDKISRARLQQVESYAKQLALSMPDDET
jgi:hypothetical protein